MIEWAKSELARIEHNEDGMQDCMDAVKFNKIKAIIDNWAVDDDEHELLEKISDIVNDTEEENER